MGRGDMGSGILWKDVTTLYFSIHFWAGEVLCITDGPTNSPIDCWIHLQPLNRDTFCINICIYIHSATNTAFTGTALICIVLCVPLHLLLSVKEGERYYWETIFKSFNCFYRHTWSQSKEKGCFYLQVTVLNIGMWLISALSLFPLLMWLRV